MNKKGQTMGLAIVFGICFFIIGLMVLNFVKDEITRTRSSDNLDCSNTAGISDGTKLTCLVVDIVIPYLILLVLSVVLSLITVRLFL